VADVISLEFVGEFVSEQDVIIEKTELVKHYQALGMDYN